MAPQDKATKFQHLWNFVNKHTATYWGESFIKGLTRACEDADLLRSTPKLDFNLLKPWLAKSEKRLFIFYTDGVLVPYRSSPFLANPSSSMIQYLEKLCEDKKNVVYIVSGRDRAKLLNWFGKLPVSLIAEHGYFILDKCSGSTEWEIPNPSDFEWKAMIKPIFEYFKDRTPGSYLEEKETSLTWHYRNTERDFGAFRAQELQSHLADSTFPVDVVTGDKTIEVRPYNLNYTVMVKNILSRQTDASLILYCGPNCRIESNCEATFPCGVGNKNQKYFLNDYEEVEKLIEQLSMKEDSPTN